MTTTGLTSKTSWSTQIRFDELKKKTQLGVRGGKGGEEREVMNKGREWYV